MGLALLCSCMKKSFLETSSTTEVGHASIHSVYSVARGVGVSGQVLHVFQGHVLAEYIRDSHHTDAQREVLGAPA